MFQSPRSGKFVSDLEHYNAQNHLASAEGFNPLDRGNLYQILMVQLRKLAYSEFQSPRSGKFVSDHLKP